MGWTKRQNMLLLLLMSIKYTK